MIKKGLVLFTLLILALISGYFAYAQVQSNTWYVYVPKNDKHAKFLTIDAAVSHYIEVTKESLKMSPNYGRCYRQYYIYGDTSQYVDMVSKGQELDLGCVWPSPGVGSTADTTWGILDRITCYGVPYDNSACFMGTERANEKSAGPCCQVSGNAIVSNPINALTGNKLEVYTDFEVPGSPYLSFTRYYNSQPARAYNYGGLFGDIASTTL